MGEARQGGPNESIAAAGGVAQAAGECGALRPLFRSGKVLNEKLDVVRLTFYTVRHKLCDGAPRAAGCWRKRPPR